MATLFKIFEVPIENYSIKPKSKEEKKELINREVDFFLLNKENIYKCEVKLMGKGNPESADVVIARDSKIFIADKLSEQNKAQLNSLNIEWVELRQKNGFMKFEQVLENLKIPHRKLNIKKDKINKKLDKIFKELFK